jgi:hypothetical protein
VKPNSEPIAHSRLRKAYEAFNARDIDTVLSLMHREVRWPNGWEGGYVYGHDGVREYWTRQWAAINPRVEPVRFGAGESGATVVDVHAVIRDLAGAIIADQMVQHVYFFEGGLIRSMELRKS